MTEIWRCDYCHKEVNVNYRSVENWHTIFDSAGKSATDMVYHYCEVCYGFYNIGVNLGHHEWLKLQDGEPQND